MSMVLSQILKLHFASYRMADGNEQFLPKEVNSIINK